MITSIKKCIKARLDRSKWKLTLFAAKEEQYEVLESLHEYVPGYYERIAAMEHRVSRTRFPRFPKSVQLIFQTRVRQISLLIVRAAKIRKLRSRATRKHVKAALSCSRDTGRSTRATK